MPEGPELFLSAKFVNSISSTRLFTGKVTKSEVSVKNPDIPWDYPNYIIQAESRGKEMKLTLKEVKNVPKNFDNKFEFGVSLDILFHFGMSGKFAFTTESDMDKHAHLHFRVKGQGQGQGQEVLSFVDTRRFGRWEIRALWGEDRGPCIIQQPEKFRENVLQNLDDSAFNRPICEVMLNQKYFNGIGNYLRAEILYRVSCPPFACARQVLESESKGTDILDLCHTVPIEVTQLGCTKYFQDLNKEKVTEESMEAFENWLQCYNVSGMKSLTDHNKRTIWFTGEPGPLVPSAQKPVKRRTKVKTENREMKVKREHNADETKVKEEAVATKMKIKIEIKNEDDLSGFENEVENDESKPKVKAEEGVVRRRSGRLLARTKQQARK